MQSPDSRQPPAGRWVSFDQARMILGMTEGTLRRAIRDGKVVAEQRRRNPESATDQRMIYEVLVTDPPAAAMPTESVSANEAAAEPPAATTKALDVLAEMTQAQSRQLIAQAETIADLRERAGRAETRAETLHSQIEQYAIDTMEQTERAVRAEAERDAAAARAQAAEAELRRLRGRRWYDPRTW
jgi:hypothetical protein